MPGLVELDPSRGHLAELVAEGVGEGEGVAQVAARVDPAGVVLELRNVDTALAEQPPAPLECLEVVSLGIDLEWNNATSANDPRIIAQVFTRHGWPSEAARETD
jgi:hypothetical protein